MKKWFCTVCLTVFCTLFLTIAVYAADSYTISPYADTIRNYEKAYTAIYTALEKQQTYLDITELRIRDYEILRVFEDVYRNSPEFFYVRNTLHYRYTAM